MPNSLVSILLVEDSATDAEIIQRSLRNCYEKQTVVQRVLSLSQATEALRQTQFDIVLTDLGLPDSQGLETVVRLKALNHRVPIVALTAQDDDSLGLKAIRAGANDYIPKSQISPTIVSRSITYTIERFKMGEKIIEANRRLENKNERLAQMYSMSQQFVDNVSHEFRTPLTVIREFAAIIRDGLDGPVTAKQEKRLSTLINRTDDLANMVDDLLDTSRLEAGLLKTCRQEHKLSEIISQAERMLRTRATTKKINVLLPELPVDLTVFCDEEKLRRVLINLLVNAIKFTPIGGQIEILVASAGENQISISVSDTGPGIPAADLKRIFDWFQQVEAHHRMASCRGFGLGLSIARALASLNLGSLQVESVEGKGSRFSVLVPLARVDCVLNCYLEQRVASIAEANEISVVEFTPETLEVADASEVLGVIDDFLRTSVKTFDLALQTDDARWLLYTCNSESTLPAFISRIEKEWDELRRNHYGAALPNLIQEHKLTIDVESGRTTLLDLAIPDRFGLPESEIAGDRAKRVLVVDDEVEVAEAIESRLRASGFDVEAVHDGAAGLAAINRIRPDAVLLDMRMPNMDGLTVLKRLRSEPVTKSTPVVVVSASLHDKQLALDCGANFFIQKPYQSNSLVAAIDSSIANNLQTGGVC